MSAHVVNKPDSPLSPIIILGMHRSGTSYLASIVGAIGVNIGTELLEAAPDNPRGYFEDRDFVEFHAGVLTRVLPEQAAGSSLGNILARNIERIDLTPGEREQAIRLAAKREGRRIWGWKDPRTCLLLDFWLERYPEATLIAVYRHPLEVYSSIIRRQKLQVIGDESLIIDTWTAYNKAITRIWPRHRGQKFLIGTGDEFRDPKVLAKAIRSRLRVQTGSGSVRLPSFEANEFMQLPIDRGAHDCFSAAFPEAGSVFDELHSLADIPLGLIDRVDPIWRPVREWILAAPENLRLALAMIVNLVSPKLGQVRDELFRAAVYTAIETGRANATLHDEYRTLHKITERNGTELTEWRAQYLSDVVYKKAGTRAVFLWGNNSLARRVTELLAGHNVSVSGLIDREGDGSMRPDDFFSVCAAQKGTLPWVAVCSRSARGEIAALLEHAGLKQGDDFVVLPTL